MNADRQHNSCEAAEQQWTAAVHAGTDTQSDSASRTVNDTGEPKSSTENARSSLSGVVAEGTPFKLPVAGACLPPTTARPDESRAADDFVQLISLTEAGVKQQRIRGERQEAPPATENQLHRTKLAAGGLVQVARAGQRVRQERVLWRPKECESCGSTAVAAGRRWCNGCAEGHRPTKAGAHLVQAAKAGQRMKKIMNGQDRDLAKPGAQSDKKGKVAVKCKSSKRTRKKQTLCKVGKSCPRGKAVDEDGGRLTAGGNKPKRPWLPAEDELLRSLVNQHGVVIATRKGEVLLPGRTNNAIKQHYYRLPQQRSAKRKAMGKPHSAADKTIASPQVAPTNYICNACRRESTFDTYDVMRCGFCDGQVFEIKLDRSGSSSKRNIAARAVAERPHPTPKSGEGKATCNGSNDAVKGKSSDSSAVAKRQAASGSKSEESGDQSGLFSQCSKAGSKRHEMKGSKNVRAVQRSAVHFHCGAVLSFPWSERQVCLQLHWVHFEDCPSVLSQSYSTVYRTDGMAHPTCHLHQDLALVSATSRFGKNWWDARGHHLFGR